MTWIRFEGSGEPAPALRLPGLNGSPIAVSDFRGRANVLLLFVHAPTCAACGATIDALAAQWESIRQNDAEVVVVVPTAEAATPPQWANLHLLADAAGELRRQYAALIEFETPREVMLFVLNLYTVPHVAWVGTEANATFVAEALEWLEIVVHKCATCDSKREWSTWAEADSPEWEP